MRISAAGDLLLIPDVTGHDDEVLLSTQLSISSRLPSGTRQSPANFAPLENCRARRQISPSDAPLSIAICHLLPQESRIGALRSSQGVGSSIDRASESFARWYVSSAFST